MHFLQGALVNEYIKKRIRILAFLYIFGGFAVTLLLLQTANSFFHLMPDTSPSQAWNIQLTQEADQLQQQLTSHFEMDHSEQETAEKHLSLIRYQLNNDISPSPKDAVHNIMNNMKGVFIKLILPVLLIIVGGDIFSSEFSNKTLKLSLLRPVGRTNIVFAKWMWLVAISSLILLMIYTFSFVLNLKNGLGNWTGPVVIFQNSPSVISGWLYLLIGLLSNLLVITCYASFILFVSYFIRSVGISSALLLSIFIFSSLLLELQHKLPPIRYLFFNHTDLLAQLDGTSANGFDLGISALILACTSGVLYVAVWLHFRRSDITV